MADLEVKICDDEGNIVPDGQRGEIVIKGENVMAGYWKNPESTAKTIVDGWLHTGDMGYVTKKHRAICGSLVVSNRCLSMPMAKNTAPKVSRTA